MIVYLARDIPAFVMYCVYGKSRSSLLIESTDSMIIIIINRYRLANKVLQKGYKSMGMCILFYMSLQVYL